jgi:DNA-binding MarR family transcriptional regulator
MNDIALFRLIGSISRQATTDMNQYAAAYQLDNNLFLYLIRIVENEGISQSELAQLVKIDKTTLSRALKKLEIKNYLIRKTNPMNKKFNQLFPTPKAKEIYQTLHTLESHYTQQALQQLTMEEKQLLNQLLQKINSTN